MRKINVRSDDAFRALDAWLDRYGWAGYDPYDIQGQDWYLRLFGGYSFFRRKLRGALSRFENALSPWALRRILGIQKQMNAKGIGLIAGAYIARYRRTGDEAALVKATQALDWLSANKCTDYPGVSWGYPFHWHSRILIPRGTPSVVVTGTVGAAILDHYEVTRDPGSLEIAHGIARFFLEGLNRPVDEGERLCFSYTPLDNFQVHNANLFAAAFLARLARLTEDETYAKPAVKCVQYTLDQQNSDGSFYYWGSEPPTIIDHYHTGFVLRHLHTVQRALGIDEIQAPLSRGYHYYLTHLFTEQGIPKHTPNSLYPIDIHSCAEALLCIRQIGPQLGGIETLESVLEFTVNKMRMPEGWFIAGIERRHRHERRVVVPYMRWGQAWMLAALAQQ